jgi:hypothetical protein
MSPVVLVGLGVIDAALIAQAAMAARDLSSKDEQEASEPES